MRFDHRPLVRHALPFVAARSLMRRGRVWISLHTRRRTFKYLVRTPSLTVIRCLRSCRAVSISICSAHPGISPRVAVHKNTEFRRGEIDGCFDALSTVHDVELVHVQQNVSWRGIFVPERKKIDPYPVPRGFYLPLSETEALLWTQGNARSIVGGNNFYKEGRGIPEPLLIKRFAGQNDLRSTCRAILALSKMDWNNDGPYDRLPVTLNFASILANIVKRMQHLEAKPYPFRLFM